MGECAYCGTRESLPFRCKFCGEQFCGVHRLPENHECHGLETFKKERGKEPEKWIYEPFKTKEKAPVGKGVKKPLGEQIFNFLETLDTRKILYGILIVIILLTLSKL
jgi:hypothetical protein